MDQRSFVENLFGVGGESRVPCSQFVNEFVGLNELLIQENIQNFDARESSHPIDLDGVDILEAK